jgi:hypothetical protein
MIGGFLHSLRGLEQPALLLVGAATAIAVGGCAAKRNA